MNDTFMVLNHGSTTDNTKSNNIITIISKHYEKYRPDYSYTLPGFGSGEYVKLLSKKSGMDKYEVQVGKGTKVYAHGAMHFTADWLHQKLYSGDSLRDKYKNLRNIVFIGWSRGCITTWYQIHALEQAGFDGNFHVLNFDPCYGPVIFNHSWIYRGMNSRKLRNSWEVLMLFCGRTEGVFKGSGAFILPPFPSTNQITKRAFIPGDHGAAVRNTEERFGAIWKIGFSIAESFLRTTLPMQLISPPELHLLPRNKHREIYAKCKMNDSSSNYSGTPRNIGGLYSNYKSGTEWGKSGFFYNHFDYEYLRNDYPNLASALCRKTYNYTRLELEWKRLFRSEPLVMESVYNWVNKTHLWQGVQKPVKKLISDVYRRNLSSMF